MAGFREFVTGEVLTAANVDDFLAKQAVMKFADAAARNTALGTAVGGSNALREGMVAYLDDTDELLKYDGTDWLEVGAGGLVAVKSAVKTDTQASSLASGAATAVSGLTISHGVADAANHVLLFAQMMGAQNAGQRPAFALTAGGSMIDIGASASSRVRVGASSSAYSASDDVTASITLVSRYLPGSTSSITYGINIINVRSATVTNYVNRSHADTDGADSARGASTLVLMEVKV